MRSATGTFLMKYNRLTQATAKNNLGNIANIQGHVKTRGVSGYLTPLP